MNVQQQDAYRAVFKAMSAAADERPYTAPLLSQWTGLSLPVTKAALRRLVGDGLVRRRTDPAKPTSYLYFRAGSLR